MDTSMLICWHYRLCVWPLPRFGVSFVLSPSLKAAMFPGNAALCLQSMASSRLAAWCSVSSQWPPVVWRHGALSPVNGLQSSGGMVLCLQSMASSRLAAWCSVSSQWPPVVWRHGALSPVNGLQSSGGMVLV
ncbi:hypothetical protein ACOMHN_032349 [Nucella lapillus]